MPCDENPLSAGHDLENVQHVVDIVARELSKSVDAQQNGTHTQLFVNSEAIINLFFF